MCFNVSSILNAFAVSQHLGIGSCSYIISATGGGVCVYVCVNQMLAEGEARGAQKLFNRLQTAKADKSWGGRI